MQYDELAAMIDERVNEGLGEWSKEILSEVRETVYDSLKEFWPDFVKEATAEIEDYLKADAYGL